MLVFSKKPHLIDREKAVAIFGAELRETIGHDVHHRARLNRRRSETATDTEVEGDVESFRGQRTRTPRRGRDHTDTAHQHIDFVTGRPISRQSRADVAQTRQSGDKRADFALGGGHDENPHEPDYFFSLPLSANQRKRELKSAAGARNSCGVTAWIMSR